MKIEILGSGGSVVTPRPGCYCESCIKARLHGAPFIRTGPSVFIHDYSILIDTPEDIGFQLNRSQIDKIKHCLYSHWHGDHVLGRRIWYTLNYNFKSNRPIHHRKTTIYLTETEKIDFEKNLGHFDHFRKLEHEGLINIVIIKDNDPFLITNLELRPYQLEDKSIFAFLLKENKKRICIAMDDLYGWEPPTVFCDLDLLILPIGIFDFHPISGKKLMSKNHHLLRDEMTFVDTLSLVKKLRPKQTVFMHIEEHDHIGLDSLRHIEENSRNNGYNVLCAYDGMQIIV
ncbi:TPA: hypothetical protein DCX66_03975 [Candidatus Nomurabacteria bacterium]|uniref:Metal-dependent hydrolase n=1 Tax=Candidatus Nomurabacteria bacterium GW2011_GWE1_35_16 TaxID=1618761 RepID=A0A0G0BA23_9BACT|nr:MAG: Metal-dependent hydrolase [Candidatus Nomurabacteria bacterium GW2011_GWF1_34_20]KKP62786.1 MAG: Metal-dependent hydrolase [Candidatus Nomurabacteria bacterium GW2011_GWE2_34_25]KKP66184.1 MAG: Metal-dependent hydrolase [Candidatus Nomurabacteria bacterium GW2011_GWE1_35_16]HAE36259.1 hypothetical protein [Candidatus Nomurabacteria bacterium]HAX65596.1 hypothetical protein [Candidatus Nomurabacteria bacterium]